MPPSHSSHDAGREPSVRVVRRQLITAHGAKEMPTPRVVLHLPDLDALQTVALGPVRPSGARRRIDAAHDIEPTSKRSSKKQDAKKASEDNSEDASSSLLNLLRVPIKKWLSTEGAGKFTAGSLVVLMQQPKVMLGAIVALGMQLAAILAMLGGGSSADKSAGPTAPDDGHVAHNQANFQQGTNSRNSPNPTPNRGGAAHDHRPIQTPMNAVTADGKPFMGLSLLPAPQSLAGVDPKDVPPWQAPVTNLPTPTATAARSEAVVAAPSSAQVPTATAAPVFSGPTFAGSAPIGAPASLGTGNVALSPPQEANPTVTNTSTPATNGPTNVVQANGGRAKLKGTIQRKPSGAN